MRWTFEAYLKRMKPWVLSVTRRRARPAHPYLSQEDLIQDGFMQLWTVWRKHHRHLPREELCRMGTVAVKRAAISTYSRARAFGASTTGLVSLDAPATRAAAIRVVGEDGVQTALAGRTLLELERSLPGLEQRLLQELIAPRAATQAALQQAWAGRRQKGGATGHQNWRPIRDGVLAQVLRVTLPRLRLALERIEAQAERLLNGSTPIAYDVVRATSPLPEEDVMAKVDAMFPQEPSAEGAAEKAPKAPKAEKAAKAPKAAKKAAPKAKAAKKAASGPQATRTTTAPKGAFPVGTEVVYLGGSRCAWLKAKQKGVVKRYHVNPGGATYRYGVDFELDGKPKSTQLATKYVEKKK